MKNNMDAMYTPAPNAEAVSATMDIPNTASCPAPKAPRYVGRITLGVALVFIGIAITLTLFVPGQRLFFLVKLLPLILVFLGVEVLISAARWKDRPVKVGIGLTVLSLLLITGSVCSTLLPALWTAYGPEEQKERIAMETALKDFVYEVLDPAELDSVVVSVDPVGLTEDSRSTVRIDLLGNYTEDTAFAEAVTPMVQALSQLDADTLILSSSGATDYWSLHLDRHTIRSDFSEQELLRRLTHERVYWDADGSPTQTDADRYDQLVEQGTLVSADLVTNARQEGWNQGYQQGVADTQARYDTQPAA